MKPRRGRPPLGERPPGKAGRSPVIKVPVKETTRAELQKQAGGLSLASVARRILERATKT